MSNSWYLNHLKYLNDFIHNITINSYNSKHHNYIWTLFNKLEMKFSRHSQHYKTLLKHSPTSPGTPHYTALSIYAVRDRATIVTYI